ncbi:spermatogenesis-associated protein 13 [Engraulis encrasicolus]|uniref:spermatogenesis-associated protein 13 n=1 Tax=Engraulis encrasicolus TaxID=184585 RepID=UPI002FD19DFA
MTTTPAAYLAFRPRTASAAPRLHAPEPRPPRGRRTASEPPPPPPSRWNTHPPYTAPPLPLSPLFAPLDPTDRGGTSGQQTLTSNGCQQLSSGQGVAQQTSCPSPSDTSAEDCGPMEAQRLMGEEESHTDTVQMEVHEQGSTKCIWKTPEKDADELESRSAGDDEDALTLSQARALLSASDPSHHDSAPSSPALSDAPAADSPTTPTATPSTVIRRRSGRPRPRPFSDYGQLVNRKFSIPEEVRTAPTTPKPTATSAAANDANTTPTSSSQESASPVANGNGPMSYHGSSPKDNQWRQRPMSVIEGMDRYPSPGGEDREEQDSLPSPLPRPPMPSHQVPPYRAVSARLRPNTMSQSTPIGLDRLGRRKLHRVLSDGPSEGCPMLDDSVSEEDGSFDELTHTHTPYLQTGVEISALNQLIWSGHMVYAEALWDHVTMEEQELAFKAGDVIRLVEASSKDWWYGAAGEREAWFPSGFVRVRVNQEEESSGGSVESVEMGTQEDQEAVLPRDKRAQSTEHREQMRTNVVREIMNTERDYIKHLRDICDGYIRQCRKHPGMFTEQQLRVIFSNIEDIYKFQRKFVKDLERNYNKEEPHLSQIGSCFLQQGDGFSIYSDYCNTHPVACVELQRLMKLSRYKHFFEACRLLQQMIDISLAGFLLTPVQKICKYPLQLGELLKYTPKDHSDHQSVSDAYEAMKNVASLINERKRRLESIDTIAQWQVAILRWEGQDVLARSSELVHSGELQRVVRQGKTQQRSFFLFDHQLVLCKKDVLRRDLLHYRGRLDMDATELQELADGRDGELGALKNAIRLRNKETGESLTLCCRKAEDKQQWMAAFARERRRVQEDEEMGMEISQEQRAQAIINALKAKQGKIKSMGYSGLPVAPPLHPIHQRHVTVPTSVPQQQVFALVEPKRKSSQLWAFTRHALFRK